MLLSLTYYTYYGMAVSQVFAVLEYEMASVLALPFAKQNKTLRLSIPTRCKDSLLVKDATC